MRVSGLIYWVFIGSFIIQILFSREWMVRESEVFLFALIPFIASLIVVLGRKITKHLIWKI